MFRKFLSYYKKHYLLVILDLLCVLLMALIDIVFPYFTRYIINGKVETIEMLIIIGVSLLVLYSLRYLFAYIIGYYGHVLGIKIETDMRQDLFEKFEKMDYQYFDDKKSGELLANLTTHLNELSEMSHHTPEDIFSSSIIIIGSAIICFIVNPILSSFVSIGIISLFIFTLLRRKKMMKCFRSVRKEQGEISAQINSSLSGMQLTKAFDNEKYEIDNFKVINGKYKKARLRQVKEIGFFHSTTNYLTNITNLILLIIGGIMFINKSIDAADLIMFFLYVNFLISPITKLSNTVETTQQAWSGFERFYNIMKIENKITSKYNPIYVDSFKGKIEFKNVTFKYKENSEDVLNNFNLIIEPGMKIAIVGETGVGKSTISKIIPRFYEVNDGEILIDDVNIKDYELYNLRRLIGHVQQDVFIFWGTIRDNILYGNPLASEKEIIEASKKANIHEFIMSLPNGYDTLCGERGIQLSGGQKQRISIARIFLKNPNILILDEATSALDNVTEKLIQKSFDELAINKTTIMIAHRLTTIKDADLIVVLGKNGIIEKGKHNELMSLNGIYSKMYNNGLNLENNKLND